MNKEDIHKEFQLKEDRSRFLNDYYNEEGLYCNDYVDFLEDKILSLQQNKSCENCSMKFGCDLLKSDNCEDFNQNN